MCVAVASKARKNTHLHAQLARKFFLFFVFGAVAGLILTMKKLLF